MTADDHHFRREDLALRWQRIASCIAEHPENLSIPLANCERWLAFGAPSIIPTLSGTPEDMTIRFQAVQPGWYSWEWSDDLIDWIPGGETHVDTPRLLEFEHGHDEAMHPPAGQKLFYRVGFLAAP